MWVTRRGSAFNAGLILLQRPGAQYVETEKAWQEKYGRYIKHGSAWELRIGHIDGHKTKYYGINAYPPGWEDLLEPLLPFSKKQYE